MLASWLNTCRPPRGWLGRCSKHSSTTSFQQATAVTAVEWESRTGEHSQAITRVDRLGAQGLLQQTLSQDLHIARNQPDPSLPYSAAIDRPPLDLAGIEVQPLQLHAGQLLNEHVHSSSFLHVNSVLPPSQSFEPATAQLLEVQAWPDYERHPEAETSAIPASTSSSYDDDIIKPAQSGQHAWRKRKWKQRRRSAAQGLHAGSGIATHPAISNQQASRSSSSSGSSSSSRSQHADDCADVLQHPLSATDAMQLQQKVDGVHQPRPSKSPRHRDSSHHRHLHKYAQHTSDTIMAAKHAQDSHAAKHAPDRHMSPGSACSTDRSSNHVPASESSAAASQVDTSAAQSDGMQAAALGRPDVCCVLTMQIGKCTHWQQLAQLLSGHHSILNHIHISAMFVQLVKLQQSSTAPLSSTQQQQGLQQLLQRLVSSASKHAKEMTMWEITSIMAAVVKLRCRVRKPLFITLMEQAAREMDGATAQGLAQLLWAVASQGMAGLRPDWFSKYMRAVAARWVQFTPQGLVLILYSLAVMQYTPHAFLQGKYQAWLDQLLSHLLQQAHACNSQDVALAVWSAVRLNLPRSHAWLQAMYDRSWAVLPSARPEEVACTIWAVGKLQWCPSPGQLQLLYQHTQQQLPAFTPQGLSMILYSLATLGVQPPCVWLQQWVDEASLKFQQFTPQGMANLIQALAMVNFNPGRHWVDNFHHHLEAMPGRFEHTTLSMIQEAYLTLGYTPQSSGGSHNGVPHSHHMVNPTDVNSSNGNGNSSTYKGSASSARKPFRFTVKLPAAGTGLAVQ